MSSIPQEFLSGTADRRWLRLDAPVLGNLSIQQITQQEQTLNTISDSASSDISTHSDKNDE
jgi:hypothetical protein